MTNATDPSGNVQENNARWENGGQWWLRNASVNYHGFFGENSAGEFKEKTWGNLFYRHPIVKWFAAGTVHVMDITGTVQLSDTIICDGERIPVNINISGTARVHLKLLNRLSYFSFLTSLGIVKAGSLANSIKGASFFQLGVGVIPTILSGVELWGKLKRIGQEMDDFTSLRTVIDTESVKLKISPMLVVKSGLKSLTVNVSGVDFGHYESGFRGREEGRSFYEPGKGKWKDGMWNYRIVYQLLDFPFTPD